jgi:hypothetical protein
MGIYGTWNSKFSHYDGHHDNTNWGNLVSLGTGSMQRWINQHSAQCIAPSIDITNTDLTTVPLYEYQVIVILDLFHNPTDVQGYFNAKKTNAAYNFAGNQRILSNAEVKAFQDWYSAGGKGFVTTIGTGNSPPEATNVNKLLAPFGIQYDSVNNNILAQATISGFKNTCPIAKPITTGVGKLWIRHGTNILFPGLTESATFSNYATGGGFAVGAARILSKIGSGPTISPAARVNVWGDEWITYDDVWSNYDAGPYWDHVLTWLSPSCPRPPSTLCP